MTPAQREQTLAAQRDLERREQQIRDRAKAQPAAAPASGWRRLMPEVLRPDPQRAASQQIARAREAHFEDHDYYIDADGTAYAASVNTRTGDIELEREEREEARGNEPARTSRRSHRIHTDASRTNRGITSATTREAGRPVENVRTETQNVGADGSVRSSQIAVDQTRRNADGSTDRSHTAENYDARNRATSRVQRQEHEARNGDSDVRETTTRLGSDGQTPTEVRSTSETTRGREVTTRDTRTEYRADGTTPRRQSMAEGGTNADGSPKLAVNALTDYDDAGDPATTFIRRDGELPRNTPATEYLTWGGNGDVRRRVTGDASVTEQEYGQYVASGRRPRDGSVADADPAAIPGGQDPIRYTRGDDNAFDGEALQGNLVPPLEPSGTTPSVFDIPSALRTRASAEAIESSRYATDPAARRQLDQEQQAFEQRLAGATTDAQREQLMRAYFEQHQYWIDRGTAGEDPVLMAAAWSSGAPRSTMFGSSRAAQPHATMARTGIEGVDDVENPATIDVVTNLYTDGSRDDITRTSHDGPAGAERVVVTGDHTNARGVVTEHDVNARSRVARTEQGLSPLAVTEITRERFDGATGKPRGEQYYAVATSDDRTTKLEEKRDQYGTDGIIRDTRIESTEMSRNFDAGITANFLAENQRVIDDALDGGLDINQVGTSITVPPAGSFSTRESTDIDYDASGRPIFQQTDSETTTVSSAGDENDNGVRVTTTDTTKTIGERGGSTPIFDEDGNRLVDEDAVSTIGTSEFDPDAGSAGGNRGTGFQSRESTTITVGKTTRPDGQVTGEWATPLTTRTLLEGHDDDWVADEKHLKTNAAGELVNADGRPLTGEGDGARPVELEAGDRVYDRSGNQVDLRRGSHHEEDLDFSDKFEEFMEGWGGKIVGVAGVVAGVALIATGVGSPLGVALAAGGVALASTQFAYTALNYNQGEASGWDLAIAGAGVGLMALPALAGVRTLATAGRAGNAARGVTGAAHSVDDIARGTAGTALRGGGGANAARGGRAFDATLRGGNAAGTGLDGLDAYDAGRAALQGDFYGAALMLGAIGGGTAVVRARGRGAGPGPNPADSGSSPIDATPATPDGALANSSGSGAPGLPGPTSPRGSAPVRGTPDSPVNGGGPASTPVPGATSTGAPAVRAGDPQSGITGDGVRQALPGTGTSVAGARGDGADVAARGASGAPGDVPDVVADLQAGGQLDSALGEVLRVGRTPDGRLYYLDQGAADRNRGLDHIVAEHGTDFQNVGISAEQLPDYLGHAMTNGRPIGISGRDRVVYEFDFDGQPHRVAVTVSNRGFIVGANPVSLDRTPGGLPKVPGRRSLKPIPETFPEFTRFQQGLGSSDAASALPADAPAAFGRRNRNGERPVTRSDRAPLERPLPRESVIQGNIKLRGDASVTARPDLFGGVVTLPGDDLGPFTVQGRDGSGRVLVTRNLARATPVDQIAATNPDLVARLGGAEAVRANLGLLDGQSLTVRRSNGDVESGWVASGSRGGVPHLRRTETRSVDIGELIVRRQVADPSFDGRAALRDVLEADPSALSDRPLRLRRSPQSISGGRAAHNIDDGWHVVRATPGADGRPLLTLTKSYAFEDLPPVSQAHAAARGFRPGQRVDLTRDGISVDEVLDFNRARLEGDHGQIPDIQVRYLTPDGYDLGTNRNLEPSAVTERADQAVVHTQAALDYMYSRYGYVPSGGDLRLVIDAKDTHNNASMSSRDNVLRIGSHDTLGASFDPSVIMHELGHKMVDDLSVGHYGRTQAGAIHEGYADVMAAGWTHDSLVGRTFSADGQAIRDLRSGADLITSRAEWDQAYMRSTQAADQAKQGVSAHTGSGVVTRVANRLAGDPANRQPGDLGWSEVGDLFHDSLRSGAMSRDMDFAAMSDSLRVAAARRYGTSSPQFARLEAALTEGGLDQPITAGAHVSRITSRNTVEHGLTVSGFDARGFAILSRANGGAVLAPPGHLLTGGGRTITLDAGGNPVPISTRQRPNHARSRADGSHGHALDDVRWANDPDATAVGGRAAPIVPTAAGPNLWQTVATEAGGADFASAGVSANVTMRTDRPLTAAQRDAISNQAGLPYRELNAAIRSGATSGTAYGGHIDVAAHVDAMDSAIATSRFAEGGRLYRGLRMPEADFQQLLQTGRYTDPAYMSASRGPSTAYRFATSSTAAEFETRLGRGELPLETRRKVIFVVDVAPGQQALDITDMSAESWEGETILPRNSQIDVLDVRVGDDGLTVVRGRLANPASSDVAGAHGVPALRAPLDPLPPASRPVVGRDGQHAIQGVANVVDSAQSRLTGEVFVLHGDIAGRMRGAAGRNVEVNLLTDPERGPGHRSVMDGTGANLVDYGRFDPDGTGEHAKVHSKLVVADGKRAVITTGAFMDNSANLRDMSFYYEGQVATDLEQWTLASMQADAPAMRAAADRLEQHDIYVNDPLNGGSPKQQRRLQRRVLDMVHRAESEITIATKVRDDKARIWKEIDKIQAERAAQGMQPLTVNVIDRSSGIGMHGTVVIVDGREAYAGTAFLQRKAMDGKKDGTGRQSREIGIVTADPATVAEMKATVSDWTQRAQKARDARQAAPRIDRFSEAANAAGAGAARQEQAKPRSLRDLMGRW